jgi:hypothetical protein
MTKKVNSEMLDVFCEQLFSTLDMGAGELIPMRLTEKPTAFEKYPRLLLGLIQRYDNVEAGFDEWATKSLRSISNSQHKLIFQRLAELRSWLVTNRSLFEGHQSNIAHLKRSLYGRLYAYLYPRRALVAAYTNHHKGNNEAFDIGKINEQFESDVAKTLDEFGNIYDRETLQRIVRNAQEHLINHKSYYEKWK